MSAQQQKLATIGQIRGTLVAAGFDLSNDQCCRKTWTDKIRSKNSSENERYFAVCFTNYTEADRAAKVLRELYTLAGITTVVKRTTVLCDAVLRRSGAEYVRTKALIR